MTNTVDRRAIIAVVLAALTPKCPLCLFGVLAALGASGLERALVAHVDATTLLVTSVAILGAATLWLAWRRNAAGRAITILAALLIVCGKQVWPSAALVGSGIAAFFGSAFVDAWYPRRTSIPVGTSRCKC